MNIMYETEPEAIAANDVFLGVLNCLCAEVMSVEEQSEKRKIDY